MEQASDGQRFEFKSHWWQLSFFLLKLFKTPRYQFCTMSEMQDLCSKRKSSTDRNFAIGTAFRYTVNIVLSLNTEYFTSYNMLLISQPHFLQQKIWSFKSARLTFRHFLFLFNKSSMFVHTIPHGLKNSYETKI